MIRYDARKPLVVIHIPKAAGSSFRSLFKEWFPSQVRYHYIDEKTGSPPPSFPSGPGGAPQHPAVIYGHFNRDRGMGTEVRVPFAEQFITLLRDPFEMKVSEFFYNEKKGRLREGQHLEEYVLNTKVNMLQHFPEEITTDNFMECIEKKFVGIGTVEKIDLFLPRLAKKLGKPYKPGMFPHINITPRQLSLPRGLKEKFNEKSRLEYAVYNYVFARSRL